MKKYLTTVLIVLAILAIAMVGCDTKDGEHNFGATYQYDEVAHWKACTDDGCTEVSDYAEHNYQLIGTINECSVCDYSYNTANTYEINLETMGMTVIKGVTINLFDSSNQQVATATTNQRGKARFTNLEITTYTAKIDENTLPKGFYLPDDKQEISLSASEMSVTVKLPSRLIDEQMPSNHSYKVGDIMYNFETTATNYTGTTKDITLDAYLSQYDAVILNFWYSGCNPCKQEFPAINDAYINYQDEIAFIAINNGYDDAQGVADFLAECAEANKEYVFDFVNDESMFDYYNAFGVLAFPTTIVIDRYGAIAHIETGSMPSASIWENMFEYYIADDYQPNYVDKYGDVGGGDTTPDLDVPDVDMPSSEDIAGAITNSDANEFTNEDSFTFSAYDDQYSWPWIITQKDGATCIKTSNTKKTNSYSILSIEVNLKKGQQVLFDYFASTEADTDILYVQVDSVLQRTISGESSAWQTDQLLYVAQRNGTYVITLTYQKNSTNNVGDDAVYVKNLRIDQEAQISTHQDFLYNAVDNYTLDENAIIPQPYKGFLNHVAYYLGEDGFYHVALSGNANEKSANDPILYADLYYATPWNSNSVWNLAYAGTGLFGANNKDYKKGYMEAVEEYAWIQNNNDSNYVPLNVELHQILVDVVANLGRTDHSQDAYAGVDQWLEICRYFVHYGTDNGNDDVCVALDNTVEALSWRVAKDHGTMTDDTLDIHVDVYSVHIPRGNYYRFTTTKEGAYLVRSHAELASDYDPNGQDPLGFVCDETGKILAENDNFIIEIQGYGADSEGVIQTGVNRYALYDNNFYMYVYLEANTTYHVAGCFNDDAATGEYDVTVNYIGETFSYFTSCATDPAYTFDIDDPNFTPFILPQMGKDRFFVGDDGNYYAQEFDGSQGSLLYIRLIGPTYFNSYSDLTLEQMIESDLIGTTQADKLYMRHVLNQARTTYDEDHELYGYVVATEQLVSIINKMANGSDTEDSNLYASTAWLLTAYYYRNINELTLEQAMAKYV